MTERLDVAGRLAEGRVAVEHTQRYVWACHMLGYEHPDLTSHPSRIRDWYDTEDGLDLRVLDEDCAQLRAAAAAAAEALRIQQTQLLDLAAAWTGPGADAALRFLERHCEAASAVANELRAAAQRCELLRDNLWYLIDSKAAMAIAIDDRSLAQRPLWLGAADAVTSGAGDHATAEDVVRQQITPYVDNDIRGEWLDTMRSTASGVVTAYDMVIDRMAVTPATQFDLPGDLGPPQLPSAGPYRETTPTPVAQAAYASPVPPADPVPAQSPPLPAVPDLGSGLGDVASMPQVGGDPGSLGGGLSGLSGLDGLANRIIDSMGDLFGPAADPLADSLTSDDNPFDDDPFGDDAFDPDPDPDPDHHDEHAEDDGPDDPGETESDEAPEPASTATPAGAPAPADTPPPAEVPPPGDPPAEAPSPPAAPPGPPDGSTPCEIAADALPQAGQ